MKKWANQTCLLLVAVLSESTHFNKSMTEEETRELIARQRNALYGEGNFSEKGAYVDEVGVVRPGAPGQNGPASARGHSPLAYDLGRSNIPASSDVSAPGSTTDSIQAGQVGGPGVDSGSRPNSTTSPQPNTAGSKGMFDGTVAQQAARTSNSSPGGSPPRQDLPAGSKPNQANASVAPIGTRPSGTPANNSSAKRSTTPLSPGGWGRGNGVWGQPSSGLGAPASVWG
jgi:hypothetical protein